MVPKADSHVAVVTKTEVPEGEDDDVYLPPATLEETVQLDGEGKLFTEVLVRDGSQVLPLGYIMVRRKLAQSGGACGSPLSDGATVSAVQQHAHTSAGAGAGADSGDDSGSQALNQAPTLLEMRFSALEERAERGCAG